jgi:hypothetical protein
VTLLVNLFAGPGAGKSTTAAHVFALLKGRGICAELIGEFAKDLNWEKRYGAMTCQPYLFGEQLWRTVKLVEAGVEVAVCDSPLLLSAVYLRGGPESFRQAIHEYARRFDRLNFFINRVKPYDPRGRRGREEDARVVDLDVLMELRDAGEDWTEVTGDASGAAAIVYKVLERRAAPPPRVTENDQSWDVT